MACEIEETHALAKDASLTMKHFGNQGDLEWVYVVDLEAREVRIYGDNEAARNDVRKDALSYVQQLKEDFKQSEREAIAKAINDVRAWGFLCNEVASAEENAKIDAAIAAKRAERAKWDEVKQYWNAVAALLTLKQYAKLPGTLVYRDLFLAASKLSKSERVHGLIVEGLAKIDAIENSKPQLSLVSKEA